VDFQAGAWREGFQKNSEPLCRHLLAKPHVEADEVAPLAAMEARMEFELVRLADGQGSTGL
jgi:hypothetical protein